MAKTYRFDAEENYGKARKNKIRFDESRSYDAKAESIAKRKNKKAKETELRLSYRY